MNIRSLAVAIATLMGGVALAAAPVSAVEENPAIGYAVGAAPGTWQYSSGMYFRTHPWSEHAEMLLSLVTRSQALSMDRTFAFESMGLTGALGARYALLRAGVGLEVNWVRRLALNSGLLGYQNSPGFLVEPYLGVQLPFLKTTFTEADVRLHWPVYSTDPAFGPRVMLTLWLSSGTRTETVPKPGR